MPNPTPGVSIDQTCANSIDLQFHKTTQVFHINQQKTQRNTKERWFIFECRVYRPNVSGLQFGHISLVHRNHRSYGKCIDKYIELQFPLGYCLYQFMEVLKLSRFSERFELCSL